MKHLFTPEGEAALQTILAVRPLLAFDFDGTLAPIVLHPDDARVPPAVAQHLAAIARELPVAILTGRSVADVMPRLGFAPRYVIGNHGAEDPAAAAPAAGDALNALRVRIAGDPGVAAAGVVVEDKGLSLSMHYRTAPHPQAALASIDALLVGIEPALARFGGKFVVNVVAADLPDKGDALIELVARAGASAAMFVGDDVTDEAVFRRARPPWLTVRIGRDEPQSAAMFGLDSEAELVTVLARLAAMRRPPG
ncbi:MAG: trehalose-phosphatase [Caldimonas sp.]